jgi:predicted  nucleic acid-binding Zn-ribbon protein
VHPDLEPLLALQDKDITVAQCDVRLKALEPEARALDEQIAAAMRTLELARAGIQAALERRDAMEGKIASYRTMQEQRKQRLEWVRGAKEASTLMAEIDLTRTVIAKEEADFMRSGDAVTDAERKAAEAERALEMVREAQATEREQIAGRREAIVAERELATQEREQASRAVNQSLLARYDKIRRGKAPLALFPLHGSSCGNCFTAVPTQRKALIQRGATIEGCEACGVLLYAKD